ncbi:MAG: IBR domain-containing protein [Fibromonadales bacterium]|nr:IBR domain-containing protein [Fibromonadales bacterium]
MDIKEYKCPSCGGAVKFDSSSQKMKCPYCDTEFEIKTLEEYQREISENAKDNFDWGEGKAGEALTEAELGDLSTGVCPSCAAELVGDKNTVATVCPCCGNSQIVSQRLSGFLKPDYVIPFKKDKKAATEALKKFCKGKRLLPDFFLEENNVSSIQGLYVPFWLFDAEASGHIRYKATKVKNGSTTAYNYTETNYYSVIRNGNLSFEKIPVDGSEKMDDAYMDAIEPFDYGQMKEFNPSFLAGYLAEKYDVGAEKSEERAEKRIKASVESEFERSVLGYNSVTVESSSVSVKGRKPSYTLFPVWVLNSKYKKENYTFMMNGESGRLVGRLPIDSGKLWKYSFLYSGILSAIFTACILAFLIFADGYGVNGVEDIFANYAWFIVSWVIALAMGFAYVFSWRASMNTAVLASQANAYVVKGSLDFKDKRDRFLYSKVTKTPKAKSR